MKTVRFSQVAAKCGPPEPYTLWSAPETDKKFQSALKGHRVMSIHQETTGSKKDYGEVGFTGDKQGSLLLFRKSLKAFEGCRVVGVKYELLASPPPASPVPVFVKPKKKRPAKPAAPQFPKLEPVRADKPSGKEDARALEKLKSSVRRAMQELQDGKAVAAYQTLEQALHR